MKRLVLCSFLLAGACTPQLAQAQAPAPAVVAKAPRSFPAVQAFADAMVRDGRVPSITVAIGVGDEPTTYISAGHVTLESSQPVSRDTLWRIYSMTKPVTGIAAMILVDRGKLRLDQEVADFIPAFKNSRVLMDPSKGLETRPATRPITVRDLLTHTAGLNYGIAGTTPAAQELKRTGVMPFAFTRATEAELRPLRPTTLQEFANRAAQAGLVADPGTKFSYSMSLDVLAAVVERASGTRFETFLEQELFGPLKMDSTYWQVPKSEVGRFVSTYAPRAAVPLIGSALGLKDTPPTDVKFIEIDPAATSVYLDPPSFPYGGAGLVSSARDYDRFLHMLQNDGILYGVRILRSETAKLARSNLMPAGIVLKGFGPLPPNEEAGFGAGGFSTTLEVDSMGRHRGTYGWDGAAGTRAWVDAFRRVRATMMINTFSNIGADFDKALEKDLATANVN